MMKKLTRFTLALAMCLSLCVPAFATDTIIEDNIMFDKANDMVAINQRKAIQTQADALIKSHDNEALKLAARENFVDYSVPKSIRDGFSFSSEISADDPTLASMYDVDVSGTIQRVGEINCGNGKTATMYVAAATSGLKTEYGSGSLLGARAYVTLWWIDHYGTDNELYAAQATWDTDSTSYDYGNKMMRYGTSDPTGMLFWNYDTVNLDNYVDGHYVLCEEGEFVGFTLACMSKMDIGPGGLDITCRAISTIVS